MPGDVAGCGDGMKYDWDAAREFGKRILGSNEDRDAEVQEMFRNCPLAYAVRNLCGHFPEVEMLKALSCVLSRELNLMQDKMVRLAQEQKVIVPVV